MKSLSEKFSRARVKVLSSGAIALAALASLAPTSTVQACPATPHIGGMCVFAGNFAPREWAFAHGQILQISQYTAVFALVGTTFGGDGRTNFGLPDLRGRAAVGVGTGPGLSTVQWGERFGFEFVSLSVGQIPSHNHLATNTVSVDIDETQVTSSANLNAHGSPGDNNSPDGRMLAQNASIASYSSSTPNVAMASDAISFSGAGSTTVSTTTTIGNTGSGQSHENRMPYLVVNWIVALEGTFPPRN